MTAVYFGQDWGIANRAPVRIMIVDDSVVMRALLVQMFESCPQVEIVARVATARHAFDILARESADIILLDHEMPGQKGLEALPRLIAMARGAHVVMLSSYCERGSQLAVNALSMGASDVIVKPALDHLSPAFADMLVDRFLRMTSTRHRHVAVTGKYSLRPFPSGFRAACIGVGASTGGIRALSRMFSAARNKPGVPVLLTQHLPPSFIPYFVEQVARMTHLAVEVARQDMPLTPDTVYIAPGERSLSCQWRGGEARARLTDRVDPVTQARPSVNIMFDAMAECYGAGALGVVLTGVGRDGTMGASRIVDEGGLILAQDEESSIVWGMPGSVTRSGLASAVLRPEDMPGYIDCQTGALS